MEAVSEKCRRGRAAGRMPARPEVSPRCDHGNGECRAERSLVGVSCGRSMMVKSEMFVWMGLTRLQIYSLQFTVYTWQRDMDT